jgi:hypothetical protein
MNHEICSIQNNKDWLLSEDEARVALIKMQDKTEEEYRIEKKMIKESDEAMRKWYRENDGPPPDSLFYPGNYHYGYGLEETLREQEEIYEKYNMNFEDFFQEFVEIEYEYESEIPQMGNEKMYVCQWECDLKEGLFRTPVSEESPEWVSYGRFIKDENGEWTAIYVRHDGTMKPHGYPPGGYTKEDSSPFGEEQ